MSKHVEARATINMPGLPVGQVRLVDPENPHIAMCLREGHLVLTGRTFSVPSQAAQRGVRPQQEPSSEAAPVARKPRKRARKKQTPPS